MKTTTRRIEKRRGQGLVEYAFILALVVVMLVTALTMIGGSAEGYCETVNNALP